MATKFKIGNKDVNKIKLKDLISGNELCVGTCYLKEGPNDYSADVIFTQSLKVKFSNSTNRTFSYQVQGSNSAFIYANSTTTTNVDFGKLISLYSSDGYPFTYWIEYGPTVCKDEEILDNMYPTDVRNPGSVQSDVYISVFADLTVHLI